MAAHRGQRATWSPGGRKDTNFPSADHPAIALTRPATIRVASAPVRGQDLVAPSPNPGGLAVSAADM
ncbi:hypothetical protein GCM10011574_09210 [Microbispora bryophytorum]|uniref:Uncharacterized protein n=1 Tax=Microbispora bryophytorum TaxID=1460882 RepID=A0A8H9GUY7_9ACTN|nr:hypothetical protein GCM10011574_09210 [Microbispora bryophytorum]